MQGSEWARNAGAVAGQRPVGQGDAPKAREASVRSTSPQQSALPPFSRFVGPLGKPGGFFIALAGA